MAFDIMVFFDGLGLILQATQNAEKSNDKEQRSHDELTSQLELEEKKQQHDQVLAARREQIRQKRIQRNRTTSRERSRR